jgi:hypothetical protein
MAQHGASMVPDPFIGLSMKEVQLIFDGYASFLQPTSRPGRMGVRWSSSLLYADISAVYLVCFKVHRQPL